MHGIERPESLSERLRPLGLRAVAGGQHPGWGTANALSYFGLTYLEWIWVRDAAEAAGSPIGGPIAQSLGYGPAAEEAADLAPQEGAPRKGEGPITVIFRTQRLEPWADRWRELGLSVLGPVACSRQRPDGSVLRWRLLLPPWPWPFLIEWAESDEARLAGLVARGILGAGSGSQADATWDGGHPGGELRPNAVMWAVRDLGAGADWLERVYGLKVGAPVWDEVLGAWVAESESGLFLAAPDASAVAGRTRSSVTLGQAVPSPLSDTPTSAGRAPRSKILSDWLATRGEGPFLYRFSGGAPRLLGPEAGLGAWIKFGA